MTRINSTKSLTYFQDTYDDNDNVPVVEIVDPRKAGRRKTEATQSRSRDASMASHDSAASLMSQDSSSPQACLDHILTDDEGGNVSKEIEPLWKTSFWDTYFAPTTEARVAAYTPAVVKAARAQDLDTLQQLFTAGSSMGACNAQGEALLHLPCRRRSHDLVKFLLQPVRVPVKVCDDWRKTPLHELCWNSRATKSDVEKASDPTTTTTTTTTTTPSSLEATFQSFHLLVDAAHELLFAKDKRGFTALQYVPKDIWKPWCVLFLEEHRKVLRSKVQLMGFVRSRDQLRSTLEKANSVVNHLVALNIP